MLVSVVDIESVGLLVTLVVKSEDGSDTVGDVISVVEIDGNVGFVCGGMVSFVIGINELGFTSDDVSVVNKEDDVVASGEVGTILVCENVIVTGLNVVGMPFV